MGLVALDIIYYIYRNLYLCRVSVSIKITTSISTTLHDSITISSINNNKTKQYIFLLL